MQHLLTAQSVTARIGEKTVLDNVSLVVSPSETVSLLGPNGAGKTSLLRALSGLLGVQRGKVTFGDQDISRAKAWKISSLGIGHVLQGRRCFGPLSVFDNLRLGGYSNPQAIGEGMEKVFELFPVLREKASHPAGSLSGGQQQMVAIGRALMGNPRLLLLDEPTLGLSPLFVQEVCEALERLRASGIVTIVLVEQNLSVVRAMGGRAYVMREGRIVLSDHKAADLDESQIAEIYLGNIDMS